MDKIHAYESYDSKTKQQQKQCSNSYVILTQLCHKIT